MLPAHAVMALVADPDGVAGQAIVAQGVDLVAVQAAAAATLPPRLADVPANVPFAGDSKRLLELTMREALQLGHNYIGTEHILLGLLAEPTSSGAEILRAAGIDAQSVRPWVTAELAKIAWGKGL